jgi:hypothetical protein
VEPTGIEPVTGLSEPTSQQSLASIATKPLAYSLAREVENDPSLAPITAAWPELPEPIRRAIAAWRDLPEPARQALVSAAQLALAVLEPLASFSTSHRKLTLNSKEAP